MFVQFDVLAQGSGGEEWVNILFIVGMVILWLIGGIAKATRRKGPVQQNSREGLARQPRQRESWQERLARKAQEMQQAAEARGRQATERMRRTEEGVAQGQQGGRPHRPSPPPGGRIAIRTGQGGESVMVYEQPSQEQTVSQAVQEAARRREREEALTAARRRRVMQQPPPAELELKIETAPPKLEPIVEGLGDIGWEPTKPLVSEQTTTPARQRRLGPRPAAVIDYSDPDALKKAILHYEILGKPLALRNPFEQTPAF